MDEREQIIELIQTNEEVFEDAFLEKKATDEEITQAEEVLGFEIPESYVWFLKEIGHGGCMFEFMGYGLTGKAIFADETLSQRENGLPDNLMIIQNCDEYFDCINVEDGSIVTWSQYDKDGVIDKAEDFYSYFLECIEDAIENY
ncbi:MAG: SMI1/KNR4 family protein [Eubacteriales bacterium]|nr:SMI1/KNR4 family protein [Eubacteriales bacterium]